MSVLLSAVMAAADGEVMVVGAVDVAVTVTASSGAHSLRDG